MVNIDRLNMFICVAEAQSISRAARRLHLSQPTVSKDIANLEKDLNVQLFHRSAGGVQLTVAGEMLLPWARKLIRDSINIGNLMQSLDQEVTGHLKIACSTTSGKYILPQLAGRFREKNPRATISILPCTQENIALKLLSEEADLGIASVELSMEGLSCQMFFIDHISMIVPASHPWARLPSVNPEDILDVRLLLREPNSGTRRVLMSALAKYDIKLSDLNVFLEVGNAEAIVMAVSAGLGVSFVSKMASAYARVWGCVAEIPVNGLELERRICIARKTLSPSNRAMEAFWSFIHAPENDDLMQMPAM